MEKKSCRCPHHSLTAVLLIGLAASIGLGNAGIISEHAASIAWPTFLGLIGVFMLCGKRCKCCGTEPSGGCCDKESDKKGGCCR